MKSFVSNFPLISHMIISLRNLNLDLLSTLSDQVPVTIKVAIYVCEPHHIETGISNELHLARAHILLPNQASSVDLKP